MKRSLYIQNLSVLAALGVVTIHATDVFWTFSYARYWATTNIIHSMVSFSVPVFFMLTGATLMDYRERYSTKEFFRKRWAKSVLPFIIWTALTILFRRLIGYEASISPKILLEKSLTPQYNEYFWFFIPLFSIYFCLPLISAVPKNHRRRLFAYIVSIGFLFNIFLPHIFALINVYYNPAMSIPIVSGYMLYVIAGYWISVYSIPRKWRMIIYAVGLVSLIVLIVGTQIDSYKTQTVSELFRGYNRVPCFLYSISIFVAFKYIPSYIHDRLAYITDFFVSATFGVYLTHWMVLRLVFNFSMINRENIYYRTVGVISIFILCTLLTKIIQSLPYGTKLIPK